MYEVASIPLIKEGDAKHVRAVVADHRTSVPPAKRMGANKTGCHAVRDARRMVTEDVHMHDKLK
jgi:hypothetical protein